MHIFLQVVEKQYLSHGHPKCSFTFHFKEDFVSLKIPEKGELGGWMITPFYKPKVSLYGTNSSNGLSISSPFYCRSQGSKSTASALEKTSPNVNCFYSGIKGYHQPVCSVKLV